MKKKIQSIVIILFACLVLGACSADPNASQLYIQESPLEAEIILPEPFEPTEAATIQVNLTQNGVKVENPEYVHFEIWKRDGTANYGMTEAHNDGNGRFSLSHGFEREGLYYLQVHASYNGSIIMPTKQFIVGELSESDKQALLSDVPASGGHTGGHH
nr:FixH family protein [Lysinibacillus timonensis]